MYIYIYIYVCVYMYIYINNFIWTVDILLTIYTQQTHVYYLASSFHEYK